MVKLSELHAAPGCDYTGTPLPENYVKKLKAVTAKRAGSVIAAMLKNGSVKQAELEAMGYTHGPRAVRDVRELGFGVVTVRGADGFAIYAFDDPANNINQLAKIKRTYCAGKGTPHGIGCSIWCARFYYTGAY